MVIASSNRRKIFVRVFSGVVPVIRIQHPCLILKRNACLLHLCFEKACHGQKDVHEIGDSAGSAVLYVPAQSAQVSFRKADDRLVEGKELAEAAVAELAQVLDVSAELGCRTTQAAQAKCSDERDVAVLEKLEQRGIVGGEGEFTQHPDETGGVLKGLLAMAFGAAAATGVKILNIGYKHRIALGEKVSALFKAEAGDVSALTQLTFDFARHRGFEYAIACGLDRQ